jgi:hypothetical protein
MKKAIVVIVLSSLLLSLGAGISAQEIKLPNPGITPDSIFYFLDIIMEEIGTFFTFGDLKKAERYATLAAERLAETQSLVEKGKPELVEKTLARYEMQLQNSIARAEKAQSKGQNAEKVMTRVGKATSLHLEVLAEIGEKVLKAQNALGDVPEEIPLPENIPQEVKERIQQELEIEKVLESIDSSKSLRDICAEQGGTPEMCEEFPLEKFESFEQIEAFCIEKGGSPEICTSLEAKCKEFGVTTANECFLLLSISSIKTYTATQPESSLAPSLSEVETIEMPPEELECEFNEIIFYYSDTCSSCQKVKDDGIIEKIEGLGVKVIQIDVIAESLQYEFSAIPAFVIDKKVYVGYKTFEQIKDLLNCQ